MGSYLVYIESRGVRVVIEALGVVEVALEEYLIKSERVGLGSWRK